MAHGEVLEIEAAAEEHEQEGAPGNPVSIVGISLYDASNCRIRDCRDTLRK